MEKGPSREQGLKATFIFPRRVAYHETDAMGIVHHSNHIRFYEEARVAWLRDRGLIEYHAPDGSFIFAVIEQSARYYKPMMFDDLAEIWTQSRLEGLRAYFQYAIFSPRLGSFVSDGQTTLVPLANSDRRPVRLPRVFDDLYKTETWSTKWPPQIERAKNGN